MEKFFVPNGFAILASLFLHVLLWLAYRAIARPTRSEYLARINEENRLKHEIQELTQALALEKTKYGNLGSSSSAAS